MVINEDFNSHFRSTSLERVDLILSLILSEKEKIIIIFFLISFIHRKNVCRFKTAFSEDDHGYTFAVLFWILCYDWTC